MNKPPNPVDLMLWQVLGLILGACVGVTAFLAIPLLFRAVEFEIVCALAVVAPLLGGVLGTLWGSRPRREED
jgi:hypothetical protein